MIASKLKNILGNREFLSLATADLNGRPYSAPKFLLKTNKEFLYIANYVMGKIWRNLKINAKVSLDFINVDDLVGYQINGNAKILNNGIETQALTKIFQDRIVSFSAKRVVDGVQKGKVHQAFETSFPKKVCFIKIKVYEIVKISTTGELLREWRV
jgi:nitroimidazol reductase NimA-like FMN-containing flavoprotein (pyridoxamine 5'-phosphate oxidase superfamily)